MPINPIGGELDGSRRDAASFHVLKVASMEAVVVRRDHDGAPVQALSSSFLLRREAYMIGEHRLRSFGARDLRRKRQLVSRCGRLRGHCRLRRTFFRLLGPCADAVREENSHQKCFQHNRHIGPAQHLVPLCKESRAMPITRPGTPTGRYRSRAPARRTTRSLAVCRMRKKWCSGSYSQTAASWC